MNPAFITTIKFSFAALILIFLIRNTFKFRQLIMFIDNFNRATNQYRPDPFPLSHSSVEELEDVEKEPQEKIRFFIPIEELINGFGFNFTSDSFAAYMSGKYPTFIYYVLIALQIALASAICYFLLGIPLLFLVFVTSGLIFLLAII